MNAWMMFLVAGVLLGCWDILKKQALKKQNVISVLMLYTIIAFLLVVCNAKVASYITREALILLGIKSGIVFMSWLLMFVALQNLPISVITPFNTMTPICSIFLGILVLGERLELIQWLGIAIMFSAYYFIGKVGRFEVRYIFKNKYFYCMIGGTMLNAVSSLIDKISVQKVTEHIEGLGLETSASGIIVQFWFLAFMAVLYIVAFLWQKYIGKKEISIKWDWTIAVMGLLIVVADRIYFTALNMPNTPISIAMPLRSVSIVMSVLLGGMIFKEAHLKKKLMCTLILLGGILLLFI